VWNAENGRQTFAIPDAHDNEINQLLAVGEDIWSASDDGTIKAWNIPSAEKRALMNGDGDEDNNAPAGGSASDFAGFLMKKAKSTFMHHWQRRWFVLKGDTITRYKSQNKAECQEVWQLSTCEAHAHKRKWCFKLVIKTSSKNKPTGTQVLVAAQSQEEYDLWLYKIKANLDNAQGLSGADSSPVPGGELASPDLVAEMSCWYGAVKCLTKVETDIWSGSRGVICIWDSQDQRYVGSIKLSKKTLHVKGGDELELQFVTKMISHGKYVWAAIGATVARVDPKTKRMVDYFDSHTGPIDDLVLCYDSVWSCSSQDCSIRVWKTFVPPARLAGAPRKPGAILESSEPRSMALINGLVWVGGLNGSANVWDPETKSVRKALEQKHQDEIRALVVAGKSVWMGTLENAISIWLL